MNWENPKIDQTQIGSTIKDAITRRKVKNSLPRIANPYLIGLQSLKNTLKPIEKRIKEQNHASLLLKKKINLSIGLDVPFSVFKLVLATKENPNPRFNPSHSSNPS